MVISSQARISTMGSRSIACTTIPTPGAICKMGECFGSPVVRRYKYLEHTMEASCHPGTGRSRSCFQNRVACRIGSRTDWDRSSPGTEVGDSGSVFGRDTPDWQAYRGRRS